MTFPFLMSKTLLDLFLIPSTGSSQIIFYSIIVTNIINIFERFALLQNIKWNKVTSDGNHLWVWLLIALYIFGKGPAKMSVLLSACHIQIQLSF